MRSRDWSSGVCSSDLPDLRRARLGAAAGTRCAGDGRLRPGCDRAVRYRAGCRACRRHAQGAVAGAVADAVARGGRGTLGPGGRPPRLAGRLDGAGGGAAGIPPAVGPRAPGGPGPGRARPGGGGGGAWGPVATGLVGTVPGVERVVAMRKGPWQAQWRTLWREAAGERWDLVVDLRGSLFAWTVRAGERRVFRTPSGGGHRVDQIRSGLRLDGDVEPRLWISEIGSAHV